MQKFIYKPDEKIKCDVCGVEYVKQNKSHHEKTKRHTQEILKNKVEFGEKSYEKDFVKREDVRNYIKEIKNKILELEKFLKMDV
jgi:hypothetical protein